MGIALGAIGFLGFIGCLVWFLVLLIARKSKEAAKMGMMICVILFFAGILTDIVSGDNEARRNADKSTQSVVGNDTTSVFRENSNAGPESLLLNIDNQHLIDDFFITIGTDVKREDIEDIAENMGLYINYKNNGIGTYVYRIAAEKEIANVNYPEKGSHVTVSFDGLKNNALKEITYFDEERMIFGCWTPDSGYRMADYNYPQIVYHADGDDKSYSSQVPVSDAKAIIEYSIDAEPGENLLETLFALSVPTMTKSDLLAFVDAHGLSYNSRGAGNNQIIAYSYKIGDKYGENGSYITFSEDENGLIAQMTYLYYPLNYRNGYRISFYSEAYAEHYSTPTGYVFESGSECVEYQSAQELLEQLHSVTLS